MSSGESQPNQGYQDPSSRIDYGVDGRALYDAMLVQQKEWASDDERRAAERGVASDHTHEQPPEDGRPGVYDWMNDPADNPWQ